MDITQQFFNILTRSGFQVEQMINRSIQNHLNKPAFVNFASQRANGMAKGMSSLQNTMEMLSVPFNFPTKNDLANTTNMVVQSEEKIDNLEYQMISLTNAIQDLQTNILSANQTQRDNR
ncbi:hypothetical protein [Cytobacillus gottheilii]|uniref:Uncharacterized protein n=1 Tax=Cytobacillus gottheilii TaxID=859144 RepID=A0ABX8FCL1_9BACI|nr:hypothetical protein [Cytobacillus gottheilii]QVY60882.1 hypothetical protein J1899_18190 [Cytobacillus gottheilii]